MPIWLRKYTFNEIKAFYEKESEEYEKARNPSKNNLLDSEGRINAPEFLKSAKPPQTQSPPSYITKASKK